MPKNKKVYFISDSHLGVPDRERSLVREHLLVQWLEEHHKDAQAIFLLGDIFDFWFEYKHVVPKGYVRLLGKIGTITDRGIPVHFFRGNHDMWAFDYFEKELGVIMHSKPFETELFDKKFLIGHGDGLGPGDSSYKMLKAFFSCRIAQKLFSFLHPGFGVSLARFFSKRSRLANRKHPEVFKGNDNEQLLHYCKSLLQHKKIDFFVFGHRHLPLNIEIEPGIFYINTGDWYSDFSYAEFDGKTMSLKYFKPET